MAPPPALCLSSRLSPASGDRTDQGRRMLSATRSTVLEKPTLVPSSDAASEHCPMASASEEGPPLSGQGLDLASAPRAVVPSCLGHQRVPADLPSGVLNTITQARAPSTRRLYSSKWSVFSSWCTARGMSPPDCGVTEVLSFLQELLDKGRSPSTLKVYVVAIAAFSKTTLGQSIGRNDLVIRFLRGAKRLNPPRPPSVPVWDLSTVLEAMKGDPFEPLQTIDLKHLSFKTVFLLALASVKRIEDLHALSVSATCMEFGPNDSRVILKPRHGYVPKSLNAPFRAQVISLSALPVSDEEGDASFLCPVRALRAYVSRSSVFRQTEQLFVSFSGRSKGLAASKQSLSRWIVDAIALAYTSKGMQCPLGVRAHSTRSMASSWAWSKEEEEEGEKRREEKRREEKRREEKRREEKRREEKRREEKRREEKRREEKRREEKRTVHGRSAPPTSYIISEAPPTAIHHQRSSSHCNSSSVKLLPQQFSNKCWNIPIILQSEDEHQSIRKS
ncbi:unnamed protein product [Leuciscus chuanchicus]